MGNVLSDSDDSENEEINFNDNLKEDEEDFEKLQKHMLLLAKSKNLLPVN